MIAKDEDALRCDFLETYHVFDYRALPARQAALYAAGLRPSSRIKQALSGVSADLQTILLAHIADATRLLVWQKTEDGVKGQNQPRSLVSLLMDDSQETSSHGFDTPEDFNAWRASMLGGDNNA